MSSEPDTLIIERNGEVEWLTLNRPEKLNALNKTMVRELRQYFEAKYHDHDTRVVVLKGAGRGFCAGLDLTDAGSDGTLSDAYNQQTGIRDIYKAMRRCPQPIISLVKGPACGGGFSLALASDIRIVGASAKMNAAYITIGLTGCDMGSSYFLPRLVGASLAAELLLTGRFIGADEAVQYRLASRCVADEELDASAEDLVNGMLATSKMGLRLTKDALNFSIDAQSMDAAMAVEDRQQTLMALASEEFGDRARKFRHT